MQQHNIKEKHNSEKIFLESEGFKAFLCVSKIQDRGALGTTSALAKVVNKLLKGQGRMYHCFYFFFMSNPCQEYTYKSDSYL